MDKVWYIQNLDVFEGIPKEEIMRLSKCARDETTENKTLLYVPNEDQPNIYLVKSGEVSLYHTRDGKRSVFDVVGPGGLFGNFSTDSQLSTHFAEAIAGTRTCRFSVEDFLNIVSAHPQVMLRTLSRLSERISDYEQKMSSNSAIAKEKILQELERYRGKRNNSFFGNLFEDNGLKLTHEKIAQLTGLNRVTVTRALQELRDDGKITIDKETNNILL